MVVEQADVVMAELELVLLITSLELAAVVAKRAEAPGSRNLHRVNHAVRHAELTAGYLAALADPARARSAAAALATLAGDLGLPQLRAHLRSRALA